MRNYPYLQTQANTIHLTRGCGMTRQARRMADPLTADEATAALKQGARACKVCSRNWGISPKGAS